MLKKRIIPCLDIRNGRTVKGVRFLNIADAGDPVELAKIYAARGADELVFLDITATIENRQTLAALVEKIAAEINIPFTVGGGIGNISDVGILLKSGADKVTINSAAVRRPGLITQLAKEFGSQCIVVAIDTDQINNEWYVFVDGGRSGTNLRTDEWAVKAAEYGAGEILLTSMKNDGAKTGFAIELTGQISSLINIPVIASGGAGSMEHFRDVFFKTGCSAALAASVFHYGQIDITELKHYLNKEQIEVRF